MIEKGKMITKALEGASRGGLVAGAASVISGLAMASVPVKVFGLIPIGSATVVSLPVVAAVGAVGAVAGGAAAGYCCYRKQQHVEEEFARLTEGNPGGQTEGAA